VKGADRRAYALTGARVLAAPGKTIDSGVVVVRGGVIEAVGPAGTPIPADAEVIDLSGRVVHAAFIDANVSTDRLAGKPRRKPRDDGEKPPAPPAPRSTGPAAPPAFRNAAHGTAPGTFQAKFGDRQGAGDEAGAAADPPSSSSASAASIPSSCEPDRLSRMASPKCRSGHQPK